MSKASPPSSGIPISLAAWIVLGVCLAATALAWRDVTQGHLREQRAQFEHQTAIVVVNIEQALSSWELMLHQTAALIENPATPQNGWADYVTARSVQRSAPGLQELGFVETRDKDAKPIAPASEPPGSPRMAGIARIATIYPGSDSVSLPRELSPFRLSKAAFRASHRDSIGNTAVAWHGESPQSTLLMYLPVYSTSVSHGRRGHFGKMRGYVYAHIGMRDLLENAQVDRQYPPGVRIFEGRQATPGFLLYQSTAALSLPRAQGGHARFGKTAVIDFNGDPWTIQFENTSPDLPHSASGRAGIYILGGGLLLALSLFGFTYTVAHVRARALPTKEDVPTERDRSQQELKDLINALQTLREEEQKRLAQEMHDDLGQLLAAMKMDLVGLSRHMASDAPVAVQSLNSIKELVDTMTTSVRRIIADLPPKALEDLGLFDALGLMAKNFEKRHQIRCQVCLPAHDPDIPLNRAAAIYRMIQESLNNVAKHADATDVEIRMEILDSRIMLSVADNGKGFSAKALHKPGSFGLIGMRERAASLGGGMRVDSVCDEGTTIYFSLPLDVGPCRGTEAEKAPMLASSA